MSVKKEMPIVILMIFVFSMVVVIPTVFKSVDKAKLNMFQIYGNKVYKSVKYYIDSRRLTFEPIPSIFDSKDMGIDTGNYSVCITYVPLGNNYVATLYMTDGNRYCYKGVMLEDLGYEEVNSNDCPKKYIVNTKMNTCSIP